MAVVRGDRIGESTALNKVSREAQTFYSAFVAAVPDDFGRFRVAPSHIWTAMYPRREPRPSDLRWVMRMVLELQKADAFLTYEVDGQTFAEVAKWRPTGNMVHRCPEPPKDARFPIHTHTARCVSTAVARAKEWGTPEEVSILINRFNELRPRRVDGRSTEATTGTSTEGGTGGGTPVNPSTRQPVNVHKRTSGAKAPGRESWLTPYGIAWGDRWGKDSEPPWGQMAGAFKEPHGNLGSLELLARWVRYLAASDKPRFARPMMFVQELGQWSTNLEKPPEEAKPRALQRDDRAATVAELEIIRAGRGAS